MNLTTTLHLRSFLQNLLPIVLLHLAQQSGHHEAVILHDAASIDLVSAILATAPAANTWQLNRWSNLRKPSIAKFFKPAPLVFITVQMVPHRVAEQMEVAFDWRRLHNQSQHVVFVECADFEEHTTQMFVERSSRTGRLVTMVLWHGDAWRLFRGSDDVSQERTLDYYLTIDPPHVFRTIGWAENSSVAEAPTGFGGCEVWLVQMIAATLNRTVNYNVYDYRSFQPDDCFDCYFYDEHYIQPNRMRDVDLMEFDTVTVDNHRQMRKMSHQKGPVIYTGLAYLIFDDLDIVTQYIYPYQYENYRIVVPVEPDQRANGVWGNCAQSQLLCIWLALLVAFVVIRLAVWSCLPTEKTRCGVADLCMATLGGALGASTGRTPRSRAEMWWLGTLSVFALVVGITCAGVLFQRLTVPLESGAIETLQQLVEDGRYNLMVPFSESLPPGLSEALRKKNLDIYTVNVAFILEMIWMKKPNFAYIIPETKLSIFNAPHLWYNNRQLFRVLEEIFYGRYATLKISPWYLRNIAERSIHLASDHGLFVHYERWSSVVSQLSGVHPKRQTGHERLLLDVHYITFDDLSFLFYAYLIGNSLALVVFMLELWLKHVRVAVRIVGKEQV